MATDKPDLLTIREGLITSLNQIPALKSLACCVQLAANSRDLPEECNHIAQIGAEMEMLLDLLEDELKGTLRKV